MLLSTSQYIAYSHVIGSWTKKVIICIKRLFFSNLKKFLVELDPPFPFNLPQLTPLFIGIT